MRERKHRISRNFNYRRGRRFEYRVKKYYEKLGYYVKRSYASKGAEDLLCVKANRLHNTGSDVLLIQCKTRKNRMSALEKDNLIKLALWTGGSAWYVYKNDMNKLVCVPL